jgi:hypothetical protein
VAEDAKLAFRLQEAENRTLSGSKHARSDMHHDAQGDGLMDDAAGQGAGDAAGDVWQQAPKRGKGRVPICPPSKRQEPATSSAAPQPSETGEAKGPIATVPRGRTPEPRPDRARSPRRPQAAGTPATTGESGSLGDPAAAPPGPELGLPSGPPLPEDMLSAAARGDETPAVSSSLSSLGGSREASPAGQEAQATAAVDAPPPAAGTAAQAAEAPGAQTTEGQGSSN